MDKPPAGNTFNRVIKTQAHADQRWQSLTVRLIGIVSHGPGQAERGVNAPQAGEKKRPWRSSENPTAVYRYSMLCTYVHPLLAFDVKTTFFV